jgi:hypothetical protein
MRLELHKRAIKLSTPLIGAVDTLVIRAQIRDDLLLIETLIEFRIIKRN